MANLQKDIPDFEGLYYATEAGEIFAHPKTWKSGKNFQILRVKPAHKLKPSISRYGYLKVTLLKQGVPKYCTVQRLIALTFIPNPENKPEVNHEDGNKLNNAVSNLTWATSSENKIHAFKIGLRVPTIQPRGENNKKAKLTNKQAQTVRTSRESVRLLAKKYGVHHSIIYGIKKGTRYKKETPI